MLGKEAAVFVASGTMANLVSVLSHCQRGDEVILGDKAHIFLAEQGGAAAVGGIQPRTVPNLAGRDTGPGRRGSCHSQRQSALSNYASGLSGEYAQQSRRTAVCRSSTWRLRATLAHRHGLSLHVDGATLVERCGRAGRVTGCAGAQRRQRERVSEQGARRAGGVARRRVRGSSFARQGATARCWAAACARRA